MVDRGMMVGDGMRLGAVTDSCIHTVLTASDVCKVSNYNTKICTMLQRRGSSSCLSINSI
jgi:hypothetical protein